MAAAETLCRGLKAPHPCLHQQKAGSAGELRFCGDRNQSLTSVGV